MLYGSDAVADVSACVSVKMDPFAHLCFPVLRPQVKFLTKERKAGHLSVQTVPTLYIGVTVVLQGVKLCKRSSKKPHFSTFLYHLYLPKSSEASPAVDFSRVISRDILRSFWFLVELLGTSDCCHFSSHLKVARMEPVLRSLHR